MLALVALGTMNVAWMLTAAMNAHQSFDALIPVEQGSKKRSSNHPAFTVNLEQSSAGLH